MNYHGAKAYNHSGVYFIGQRVFLSVEHPVGIPLRSNALATNRLEKVCGRCHGSFVLKYFVQVFFGSIHGVLVIFHLPGARYICDLGSTLWFDTEKMCVFLS